MLERTEKKKKKHVYEESNIKHKILKFILTRNASKIRK